MKRLIATTLAALTAATVLVGCSADATNSASANETQIFQSAFGEAEIPSNPQRIVIVQANFLDLALAIDLAPVGSTYWGGAGGIQDYLQEDAPENMEVVGNDDEPNFEAIANLNPDLIIGDEAVEENLEKFEAIAPVAAIESRNAEGSNSWRDQLTALAEITGREDRAAEVIKEADESIEQLDANIDEPGQRTMLLRIRDDQVRQYLPDSFAGAGVPQRLQNIELVESAVPSENGEWSVIPPENIGLLDADRIIAFVDSPAALEAAENNPLWNTLPAVENDQLCISENLTPWILTGPSAASIVTSDLEECFSA
ncbi:iron-siderophore ABC transporter substrate-binding protein [Corynebacterium sp.]|uniref:iron-siderophore ABC transporter substrate-binding protein n=1 Tax=Corynebacterium sp. TaxID=1720 RepID=UPI0028AF6F5E|nr:iron-siderophore ABC transporter substrate-binding protein [Corynebacterium sp.]